MQNRDIENFENAFKEAFEKANLAPPDIVWENIEKAIPQAPIADGNIVGKTMSIQSKLLIATTIVLVSAVAYFYLNNSLTNNYKGKINKKNNETNNTKSFEPTIMDSKLGAKKMAASIALNTKKTSKIVNPFSENRGGGEIIEKNVIVELENIDSPESQNISKIEGDFSEMKARNLHLPKIDLELPSLEINTDSQTTVPYYDTNTIGQPINEKGKFWQNFKVRGGIRVSNQ